MKKILMLVLLGSVVVVFGCSKRQNVNPDADKYYGHSVNAKKTIAKDELYRDLDFRTVYFEHNSSDLTEETLEILKENVAILLENPAIHIAVVGHCDNSGSVRYNIDLGQQRAINVKEYYIHAGIDHGRITTISYGYEKPAENNKSNEDDWNRRVETKIIIKN
ncbi:MAG: OmpA family protein [Endomicrobia bacterium]|nr:OmpA family protein [Endomicrobiia bacterium]MCL2506871.1 OmpA family protein [Endomicrobiia bacterium]